MAYAFRRKIWVRRVDDDPIGPARPAPQVINDRVKFTWAQRKAKSGMRRRWCEWSLYNFSVLSPALAQPGRRVPSSRRSHMTKRALLVKERCTSRLGGEASRPPECLLRRRSHAAGVDDGDEDEEGE